jgi:REP element-mobilizing transposase RayT
MNIFQYQGQEEDHYTNILLNIISLNNCKLAKPFLQYLIPNESKHFIFNKEDVYIRKRYRPDKEKDIEMIIGVAPYQKAISENYTLEENISSIPDAWICGENFNILFEFKIRGVLDEAQISAHQKLVSANSKVIRLQWHNVKSALHEIITNEECTNTDKFLIHQFLEVSKLFKQKRKSSGIPSQIISNVRNENKLHFIITGSKATGTYSVDLVVENRTDRLHSSLNGIQSARRWIAKFINESYSQLPIEYIGDETIIHDYCVVPGRSEKKNQWNQWRIGSMLEKGMK